MIKNFTTLLTRRPIMAGALTIVIVAGLVLLLRPNTVPEQDVSTAPVVAVTTARQAAGAEEISLVGNVRAFTEAVVTTERPGRITSVTATLGQRVAAGTVLATIENAAERAAVLQAEGAYEGAQAAAAATTVGVVEAQNNLRNAENTLKDTIGSAYTTVNGALRNTIDSFYASPDNRVPGVKIDGRGQTAFLNNERVAFQTILPSWQSSLTTLAADSLADDVSEAVAHVNRTIALVDAFIAVFNDQAPNSRYTTEELQGFSTTFTALRSSLIGTRTSLQSGATAVQNAREQLNRAELAASGGTTSAADAQVKQALGVLQAAQSNLAKTILRTPISGTVNLLDVRVGDFVGAQVTVARVANNDALEVVTYVGDKELSALRIGETVVINGSASGTITAIAPAVDPTTRKTEVRIATESSSIKNGDTVSISTSLRTNDVLDVVVPITAVKFALNDGVMFLVEDGRLVERPVTIGVIRGSSVTILSGLTADEAFVRDARGLTAGTLVEVAE